MNARTRRHVTEGWTPAHWPTLFDETTDTYEKEDIVHTALLRYERPLFRLLVAYLESLPEQDGPPGGWRLAGSFQPARELWRMNKGRRAAPNEGLDRQELARTPRRPPLGQQFPERTRHVAKPPDPDFTRRVASQIQGALRVQDEPTPVVVSRLERRDPPEERSHVLRWPGEEFLDESGMVVRHPGSDGTRI